MTPPPVEPKLTNEECERIWNETCGSYLPYGMGVDERRQSITTILNAAYARGLADQRKRDA